MRLSRGPVTGALLLPLGLLSGGCDMMIAGPRAQVSVQWDKTYEVAADATLEIRNTNGRIDVRTHAAPTITVKAQRTARAVSEQGARELLARTSLEASASTTRVTLVTPRNSGLAMGQHITIDYDVLVPATVAVTLTNVNGRVDVDGVAGPAELETVNGRIIARGIATLRKAETVNGSVDLDLAALPSQGARVETVNGSVGVAMPSTTAADVSVRTVNGGISVDGFGQVQDRERRRRHYEGRINGGGPTLRIETVNGGVSVNARRTADGDAATENP